MRSILVFAGFVLAAGFLIPQYASHVGSPAAPLAMAAHPAQAANSGPRSVVVPRDGRGHFQVDARVNGRRIGFMVDTGASVVALTARDAARLGLHPLPGAFTAEVKTANGTVRAAPARLDVVEIGGLEIHDVAAIVLPDQSLSDNLLGLSFLARLRRFEYSGGQLVLEQ